MSTFISTKSFFKIDIIKSCGWAYTENAIYFFYDFLFIA